jgi:YVTN family beta-propeller protein
VAEDFGPYRLDELVGRGGMGEVWRAFDTRRKRVVALKRLGAEQSGNAEFEARFRRECELAARLNAPTVIPIHDYGEIDGRLFLDMRFVQGEDLGARLRHGPLEPAAAVRVVEQLAAALDAAHAAGLVHRDVKPSNTLLAEGDFVYLVDFGIVRSLESDTVLTTANGVVGTAGYLAPERILGTGEDHRSDVYSLACVLHECLTGERPYTATTAAAVIAAHLHSPIPQTSARDPRLRPFDAVVAAGMAKDPADRTASAGAFARLAAEALHRPLTVVPHTQVGTARGPEGTQLGPPDTIIGPLRGVRPPAAGSWTGGPPPGSNGAAGWGPPPGGAPFSSDPPAWGAAPPSSPAAPARRRRWPWLAGTAVLLVAALVAVVVIAPWRSARPDPVEVPVIGPTTTTSAAPKPTLPRLLSSTALGGDPRSLVVHDGQAFSVVVPQRFTDQVVTVDLASGVPGLPMTVSEAGGGIAVDGQGQLWVPRCVPGGGPCSLDALDRDGPLTTGVGLDRVPTNLVLEQRTGLAHVVVLTNGISSVVSVDTASEAIVNGPLPLGVGNAVLALSPDGDLLAFSDGTAQVTLVSARSGQVEGVVGTMEGASRLAFAPDGRTLYVSSGIFGGVAAVDLGTQLLTAPPTQLGAGAAGIAVSPDGSRVYVANAQTGTLEILDAGLQRIGSVTVGGAPTDVVADGDRIYLTDTADDSLLVVG